ncbi:glycosyltransferase [Vibrio sp. ZSDZ34]|uniref:Glycosyltransferase n=1 Tax=Vibrio gelatinilyticus TaxID=2893468 RepID=A0A9X1WE81_9VIBR|nr:glycosyltransferase [Vibrio gelatinilyticus]MCJ2375344.1 glycosyltransferase [Vibrio gelatinilyticus]
MKDLIVFGEDYGALPSSTQHIINYLADNRKVLWVNSIGLRQPKLSLRDVKRAAYKLVGKSKASYEMMGTAWVHPNITLANVLTIPAPKSSFARKVAKSALLHQIKPLAEKLHLQDPILWMSLPTAGDLCGSLNESGVVYYCGDDFEALAGVDHEVVKKHEQDLVEKAQLILTASPQLTNKFPGCKTHCLPHGVDVELFSTPAPRAHDLPDNGRPTAGFYGSISNWLDYELLDSVIKQSPDWNFVFIGPCEAGSHALPNDKNVYCMGPRPHHKLPSYSQHWTVSILPFANNPQIEACSPLKLLEYLAAKRPVITTPFPALEPYKSHVDCVSNANEMLIAMERAKSHSPLPSGLVDEQSWRSRGQFVDWMLELL